MTAIAFMNLPLADSYRPALFTAVGIQVVCGVLSAMLLDSGNAAAMCLATLIGFWGGVLLLMLRPTLMDLWVVRYGFLPLFGMAFVIMEVYISRL